MSPDRIKYINGKKIEQYYWNDGWVVYIDNVRFDGTFDEACESAGLEES